MESQKLIMIIVLANIVIGASITAYNNLYDINRFNEQYIDILEAEKDFFNQDNIYPNQQPTTDYQFEKTSGNTIAMGNFMFDTLLNGLNPWSFNPSMFNDRISDIVSVVLGIIRTLLGLLLVIETYFIIKNRKTS